MMKNDSNTEMASHPNAWIAVDHGLGIGRSFAPYTLVLKGDRSLYQAIAEDDCLLMLDVGRSLLRGGRVLRIRSDLESTTVGHLEKHRIRRSGEYWSPAKSMG